MWSPEAPMMRRARERFEQESPPDGRESEPPVDVVGEVRLHDPPRSRDLLVGWRVLLVWL
jgi:hypothetical protein